MAPTVEARTLRPQSAVTLGATQSGEAPTLRSRLRRRHPGQFNDEVAHWMDYFMGSGRSTFTIWLSAPVAVKDSWRILASKGLPRDLWVISVIESGLEPSATSPKGAKGPWQFISSTAKGFGLTMDYYVDERQDPERATLAAAEYFLELHEQFEGDWYLTWAAYNRGPTKVQETVFSTQKQDFWALAPHLPQETREYVPKLLAVAILMKYPSRYASVTSRNRSRWSTTRSRSKMGQLGCDRALHAVGCAGHCDSIQHSRCTSARIARTSSIPPRQPHGL